MVVSVLIVEDEAITALDLKYCLLDLGYIVVGVEDTGRDAIEAARKLSPSVVLMDIKLKGDMEGTEAAKVISKFDIPVIFVSANSDIGTFEESGIDGTFAFVSKPFDIDKVKDAIEEVTSKK